MRRLLIGLLLASVAACAARPSSPVSPPGARPPGAGPAAAAPATPDSIRWVQGAAEYHAALHQAYRLATARVEQAAATRTAGRWAGGLDGAETNISNVTYQAERARVGAGFSAESWTAWVKRREATPLPGAAEFLARVRALGGRIAIVTNRLQSECDDTAAVFQEHALAYDAMLCRPDGTPSDKNPRFDAVAAGRSPTGTGPLEVVVFVGDNIQDFPRLGQALRQSPPAGFADFGVRYVLVPNPMYGSWQ
jgi:5'-nucleotidase (lipoprotein e(P4) family)